MLGHKMETIGELMIVHGAGIRFVERIRINDNYPYQPIIRGAFGRFGIINLLVSFKSVGVAMISLLRLLWPQ